MNVKILKIYKKVQQIIINLMKIYFFKINNNFRAKHLNLKLHQSLKLQQKKNLNQFCKLKNH
jgi:hypothetical protein